MGPLGDVTNLIPGMATITDATEVGLLNASIMLERAEAIIAAMTNEEKLEPLSLGEERCSEIAQKSGLTCEDVKNFLQQFEHAQEVMGKLNEMDEHKT